MSIDARDLPNTALDAAIAGASNSGEAYELSQDYGVNPTRGDTLGDVINARLGRRGLMRGMLAVTAMSTGLGGLTNALLSSTALAATAADSQFKFKEVPHGVDENHHVAEGYDATVLLRWGDPIIAGAPDFDPMKQTPESQAGQFGYNNDYVGFTPLPYGSNNPARGLLCVNHEYTIPQLMFHDVPAAVGGKTDFTKITKAYADIEMNAHGNSVVEIVRDGAGKWSYVKGSPFNRRVTMFTPMVVSGPAAGDDRLKTKADPTGTRVLGTVNNCAGGMTPWGTYLTAEENFHGYFNGKLADGHKETANYRRYGVPDGWYNWGSYYDRMDISKEPNEPNRFGWIVEIDPYDPTSTPVKRTALGRFKHEGAETVINKDGRLVVYTGDDERYEYAYKFVSNKRVDLNNREANRDVLDTGTLFVAKFNEDGSGTWIPLVWGTGPLTPANGFQSQADVLIEARRAADLVGATPMDRPEDFEANAKTGKVYVNLTNNERRKADDADARKPNKMNPRAGNLWGQTIEIINPDQNHAALDFKWEMLIVAGNPADPKVGGVYHPATSKDGWYACPDNMAIDHAGRLWIGTDQGTGWARASGTADGIWAVETEGALRGYSRQFWRVPVGAEICGICFLPDDKTMTVAVQHPAADGAKDYKPFGRESTYADPVTRWPDFKPDMPPRPSVVLVTKKDGGVIGS